MRLGVALPGIHRVDRGAEVAFERVADLLAQRPDCQVSVFGSGPEKPGRRYRYIQIPCVPRERFERWPRIPMFRDECAYEELSFAWNLRRSYDPNDFDLTMTAGYPFLNWLLRMGRRGGRPGHVFVTQNGDWPAYGTSAEYRFFSCDGLICINPLYAARNAARWHPALIPNGVDVESFAPAPGRRERFGVPSAPTVVLMVSALIATKNVESGVRAVAKLPGHYLLLVGDGPLRDEIDQLAARLLPGRYQRLVCDHDDIGDLFRCADVFVHLAKEEGCSIACMEAIAAGLPVVTQDMPVARWLLEDQAAYVEFEDEAAVAAAIDAASLLRKPEHLAARAVFARRRTWPEIAEQYYRYLREVHERLGRVPA